MRHSRSSNWRYLVSFGMTVLLRHGNSGDPDDPVVLDAEASVPVSRILQFRGMQILGPTEQDVLDMLNTPAQLKKQRFGMIRKPDGSVNERPKDTAERQRPRSRTR